jgi:DNA repair and recombination RAD54-like protein
MFELSCDRCLANVIFYENFIRLGRIKCGRCVNGIQTKPPPPDSDCTNDLSCWHHCSDKRWLVDPVLKQCWAAGISFVFYQHSHKYHEVSLI